MFRGPEIFKKVRGIFVPVVLLLLVALSGCSPLPDLKPFADSTADLERAVSGTQDLVVRDLQALSFASEEDRAQRLERFKSAWRQRLNAMAALLAYSDSLAAIAEAGRSGSEAADSEANSMNRLLDSLSIEGAISAEVISIAQLGYDKVAQVRAAHSLAEAVRNADPAVQSIASVLAKDYQDLTAVVLTTRQVVLADLEMAYSTELGYRDKLVGRWHHLQKNMMISVERDGAEAGRNFRVNTSMLAEFREIESLLAATRGWHEPYMRQIEEVESRFAAQLVLLEKAVAGIRAWSVVHGGLGPALDRNMRPSVVGLVNVAFEMRELLKEVKKI